MFSPIIAYQKIAPAKPIFVFAIISLAILLSACGGGGGSNETGFSMPTYNGVTEQSEIDISNAKLIVSDTVHIMDISSLFSMLNGYSIQHQHVLMGGDFTQDDDEDFCLSGSLDVADLTDSSGLGDVRYSFKNCRDTDSYINGEVTLKITRTSTSSIYTRLFMNDLTLQPTGLNESDRRLNFTGVIETTFENGVYPKDDIVWSANLLVDIGSGRRQVNVSKLTREGVYAGYSIGGRLFFSDYGYVDVGLDTELRRISISGERSSLEVNYELDQAKSNYNLKSVSDYSLTYTSSFSEASGQTIHLSTKDVLDFEHRDVIPDIKWHDMPLVSLAEELRLSPEFSDPDSFVEYFWSGLSFTGECSLESSFSGPEFTALNECPGDFELGFSISDGVNTYSHTYISYFQRMLPDVSYSEVPEIISSLDSFTLFPTEHNPESGPFDYSLAYGLPGSTVSSEGDFVFSVASNYPLIASSMELSYGIRVQNDAPSFANISFQYLGDEIAPLKYTPLEITEGVSRLTYQEGGIDIDPDNPYGDIAFVSRKDQDQVVMKYNKASGMYREVALLPRVSDLAQFEEGSERLSFYDWNKDGVEDLIYSRVNASEAIGEETRLLVYDFKSEAIVLNRVVLKDRYTRSIVDAVLYDIRVSDTDSDGTNEFIFLIDGQSKSLSGIEYDGGVFLFDPDDNSLLQLSEERAERLFITSLDTEPLTKYVSVAYGKIDLYEIRQGSAQHLNSHTVNLPGTSGRVSSYSDILGTAVADLSPIEGNEFFLVYEQDPFECSAYSAEGGGFGVYTLLFDKELNLIRENATNYLASTLIDIEVDTNEHSFLFFSRECGSTNSARLRRIDPLTGNTVWSGELLADEAGEVLNVMSGAVYTDLDGNRQIVLSTFDGIISTQ